MTPQEIAEWFKTVIAPRIQDMDDVTATEVLKKSMSAEMPKLRILPNIGATGHVTYATDELTAVCPMTGIPDYYHLEVTFMPQQVLIELKSLKEYLQAYRPLPIFHEQLASKIQQDVSNALGPKAHIEVLLKAATRGGINATVRA